MQGVGEPPERSLSKEELELFERNLAEVRLLIDFVS
jgi:hypothetical protein